jgi:hypothetical protein
MRSGSVENTYEGGHGGGVGGLVVADVDEEDLGLGAGEAVEITALSSVCGEGVREEMTVREEQTEKRRSLEPGVERRGPGCMGSSMEIAVGS